MRGIFRWALFIAVVFSSYLLSPATVQAAGPLKFTSSTQYLWGDDWLGNSQNIVAQYLRLSYVPEGKNIALTGYGRVYYDFNSTPFYDSSPGFNGTLYYLYLDYTPIPDVSLRLGRQYIAFTADTAVMDGLRADFHNLGPFGITVAGGFNVLYTLDSQYERLGNYFWGIDLHLEKIRSLQLGVSFVQKYDQSDLAREEIGANFRYVTKYVSPYAQVRYDVLFNSISEATVGMDIFPMGNFLIRAEYYYTEPTFDSTSIFSVFTVDQYREYLLQAEYTFEAPVTLFAAYAKQTYQQDENADRWTVGTKLYPLKNLTLNASVDYRHGFGGNLWGFEITGDYRIKDKFILSAGVQYDEYKRPDEFGNQFARRYWVGGDWLIRKNLSLIARIEDNVNENFKNNILGRIALNWNL